jgi:hypothetical protein
VQLQIVYGNKGVYGGSVKIIAINGTYKVSDSVYFVSEDQITHLLTVVVGQVLMKELYLCCFVVN